MSAIDTLYLPVDETEMAVLPEWLWRGVNAFAVNSLFKTMNLIDMMRARHTERFVDVEVARDIAYSSAHPDGSWQRLDIWRPIERSQRPLPALMFVHGGGFRTLSKDTHWFFARAFARMGFVVFSVDYRLGPEHHYPAPLEDVSEAFCWIAANASEHGADLDNLVLAGESAGANLIMALAASTLTRRPEGFAQQVFDTGVVPRALLPMCGIFQVSDIERYARSGAPWIAMPALRDAASSYVGKVASRAPAPELPSLSDPLLVLEDPEFETERLAPALFAPVGESDPLVDDSLRLVRALRARGMRGKTELYSGGSHSFMAFMWNGRAQRCWQDMHAFLQQHISLHR